MPRCVAVWCRVAACCSVLQCVVSYCSILQCVLFRAATRQYRLLCPGVLQRVAACCSLLCVLCIIPQLDNIVLCTGVLRYCSLLQSVAEYCSVCSASYNTWATFCTRECAAESSSVAACCSMFASCCSVFSASSHNYIDTSHV